MTQKEVLSSLHSVLIFLAWMCAVIASLYALKICLDNPTPVAWFAWILATLPGIISTMALWPPHTRTKTGMAAAILVTLIFAAFSMGPYFIPAAILMVLAVCFSPQPPDFPD